MIDANIKLRLEKLRQAYWGDDPAYANIALPEWTWREQRGYDNENKKYPSAHKLMSDTGHEKWADFVLIELGWRPPTKQENRARKRGHHKPKRQECKAEIYPVDYDQMLIFDRREVKIVRLLDGRIFKQINDVYKIGPLGYNGKRISCLDSGSNEKE